MLQPRNPKCSVKTLNSVALEVIKFFEYGDTVLVLLRRARLFVFGHFSLNSTLCNYCATTVRLGTGRKTTMPLCFKDASLELVPGRLEY